MPRTIPALFCRVPFSEIMLDKGLLILDSSGYLVKSHFWNWNYRGPVLLYNSKTATTTLACELHGINEKHVPRGAIVGIAKLVMVRELTPGEMVEAACQLNDTRLSFRTKEKIARNYSEHGVLADSLPWQKYWLKHFGPRINFRIRPKPIGFFLKDICRFENPVTVNRNGVKVNQFHFDIPVSLVADQLRRLGVNA